MDAEICAFLLELCWDSCREKCLKRLLCTRHSSPLSKAKASAFRSVVDRRFCCGSSCPRAVRSSLRSRVAGLCTTTVLGKERIAD